MSLEIPSDKKRPNIEHGTGFLTSPALELARDYYENPRLKGKDVRTTKLVDMEGIAEHFNINIKVYEPKTNSEKASWRLVYGQNQHREGLDDITLGMLDGHRFYITKIDVVPKTLECEAIYESLSPDKVQGR